MESIMHKFAGLAVIIAYLACLALWFSNRISNSEAAIAFGCVTMMMALYAALSRKSLKS